MEDALLKLIVTVPAAAAVIITVIFFLKHISKKDEYHSKAVQDVSDRAAKCHEECTKAVKENRTAVTENTKVLVKLSTLLETRIKQTNGE